MKRAALTIIFALSATVTFAAAPASPVTLLGVALGQQMDLPACPLDSNGAVDAESVTKLCARAWPESGPVRTYDIGLPQKDRPAFLAAPVFSANVIDGRIEMIEVMTTGMPSQSQVLSQLVDKFGKPPRLTEEQFTNGFGAKTSSLRAEWFVGDASLGMNGFGVGGKLNRGVIVSYTKKWMAARKAQEKPEPHL